MSISTLNELVAGMPELDNLVSELKTSVSNSRLQVLEEAGPAVLATLWTKLERPLLIITPRAEGALKLSEQIALWGITHARHFPESEALPFERLASDSGTTQSRISTLAALTKPTHEGIPNKSA